MATSVFRRQLLLCCRHSRTNTRQLTRQVNIKKTLTPSAALGATVTGVLAWKIWQARQETAEILPVVTAKSEGEDGNKEPRIPHTYREVRYRQFASVEYKGVTYMTPQDFLESVTEEMPRRSWSDLYGVCERCKSVGIEKNKNCVMKKKLLKSQGR